MFQWKGVWWDRFLENEARVETKDKISRLKSLCDSYVIVSISFMQQHVRLLSVSEIETLHLN